MSVARTDLAQRRQRMRVDENEPVNASDKRASVTSVSRPKSSSKSLQEPGKRHVKRNSRDDKSRGDFSPAGDSTAFQKNSIALTIRQILQKKLAGNVGEYLTAHSKAELFEVLHRVAAHAFEMKERQREFADALEKELLAEQTRRSELSSELLHTQAEKQAAVEARDDMERRLQTANDEYRSIVSVLRDYDERWQSTETTLSQQAQMLQEMSRTIDERTRQVKNLTEELERTQQSADELQQAESRMEFDRHKAQEFRSMDLELRQLRQAVELQSLHKRLREEETARIDATNEVDALQHRPSTMEHKAPLTLDTAIKVAFCLEGRDKINKIIQYGSRAMAFYLLSMDPKSDMGKRFSELFKVTQQSRKAFRLGKSVTFYKKAMQIMDDKTLSPWQKYLQLIQSWGMVGFFIYDNMAFLAKAKFMPWNADEAAKRGGILWFCANVAGFMIAMNNINADLEKEKCIQDVLKTEEDPARIESLRAQVESLRQNRFKKFLAVIKVTCDLIVSSNTSGVRLPERVWGTKLHDGIIGPVGCVSALTVLYNTWPTAPKPAIDADSNVHEAQLHHPSQPPHQLQTRGPVAMPSGSLAASAAPAKNATPSARATGAAVPVALPVAVAASAVDEPELPDDAGDEKSESTANEPQEEQEIVAVGTISHVIRRAFHQFYVAASESLGPAQTEPESDPTGNDKNVIPVEPTAPAAPAPASVPSPTPTQTHALAPPTTTLPSARLESVAQDATDDAPSEQPAEIRHPFVALAATRKQLIDETRDQLRSTSAALLELLAARHADAHQQDEADADALCRQGLIIKAQLPLGPSHLQLDPAELQERFGDLAGTLVHAQTLVCDYHRERLDRSGNGPDAMTRHATGIVREPPGYLNATSSSTIRKDATLSMHQLHLESVKASTSASSETDAPKAQRSMTSDVMPAHEKRRNMEILERMQTKLEYLRNPRYTAAPSPSVVQQKQAASRDNTAVGDGSQNGASKRDDALDISSFVAEPSPLTFTTYDAGGIYEQSVLLRNTTSLSRRVRVLPPATVFFSIDRIVFPDASGLVAPGMHVEVRLRFAPDSRAEYKDALTVQCESRAASRLASFAVPIVARRPPPELSIPLLLRATPTLVGSHSVVRWTCRNTGGKARFWLLTEQDWQRVEMTSTFRGLDAGAGALSAFAPLRVGPFSLSPQEMELDTGESVTLELTFVPSAVGEQRERFVMVCDNTLVRVFQLAGRGCQIELSITALNARAPIDLSVPHMARVEALQFETLQVLSHTEQQLSVTNDTPIALRFTWRLTRLAQGEGETDDDSPYSIQPATGVLPASNALSFTVAFDPERPGPSRWRAELLINDVPACCMPGPRQLERLSATFQRLRDALLTPATVAHATAELVEPHVAALSLSLHGAAHTGAFSLEPNCLRLAAGASLRRSDRASVTTWLVNNTSTRVPFAWDVSRAVWTSHGRRTRGSLVVTPAAGELPPGAHVEVTITCEPPLPCVNPWGGAFSCRVPCVVPSLDRRAMFERWLRCDGLLAAPEIEFVATNELDFGLVLASASSSATLTLRNPSTVATTEWRLSHLEALSHTVDGSTSPTAHNRGMHRVSSKDSLASSSRRSSTGSDTHRSHASSATTGSGSALFTSRDVAPRASLSMTPAVGRLAPGETQLVQVTCQAGALPERFRGTLGCEIALETETGTPADLVLGAALSARAEIQTPSVFLSPIRLPLGTTYIGVPVHRELQLVNVSNLEAAFKFVEPNGPARAYDVSFSPRSGVLRSKETLRVRIVYTPRQAGRTTALMACTVQGLPGPLGLEISTNQKGLVLTYDVVTGDAPPLSPTELAVQRGISLSDGELEPDGVTLPKLAFGDAIPLGERRSLRLAIRNFSGIPAVIEMEPKRFPVALPASTSATTQQSKDASSSLSSSPRSLTGRQSSTLAKRLRSKPALLSDALDPLHRFQSNPGHEYIRECDEQREDRELLRSGHGIAFQVRVPVTRSSRRSISTATTATVDSASSAPASVSASISPRASPSHIVLVQIPPWEQVVIDVACFNNLPGNYSDSLACRPHGIPPVFLPMTATIVGEPLVLDRDCVGLHIHRRRTPPPPSSAPLEPATFTFGHVCVRSAPLTKTLRVRNRGPQVARLRWRLAQVGQEHRVVHVALRVDFAGHVQLRIIPCKADGSPADDGDDDGGGDDDDDQDRGAAVVPFSVMPSELVVPPFSVVPFQVTFFPARTPRAARAVLIADAEWVDIEEDAPQLDEERHREANDTEHVASTALSLSPQSPTKARSKKAKSKTKTRSWTPTTAAGKAFHAVRMANSLARHQARPPSGPAAAGAAQGPISAFKCLRVELVANVVEPELALDKRRQENNNVARPPSSLSTAVVAASPPSYHVKFTTWSTLAAGAASGLLSAVTHAFHQRQLVLWNALNARLTFRLECTGPFAVVRAESLAPKHPLSVADLPASHRRSSGSLAPARDGESFMFTLPPQMSVRLDVRVDAAKVLALAGGSSNKSGGDASTRPRLVSLVDGELLVRFTNKSVQTIQLVAEMLRPMLLVSPSIYRFGRVHLTQRRVIILRLANPTVVPATFSVRHVALPPPVSRAQQQERARHDAKYLDNPSVFSFSAMDGVVNGPTLTLRTAGATQRFQELHDAAPLSVHSPITLRVTFQPLEAQRRYRSRFRFVVEHGADCEVVLEGEGHLDEAEYNDQQRPMVRASELTHRNLIFRRLR
ncbi:hypothetical protein ATCC90586_000592 [Pythium insidiosum]|nr:hypothetical protein ATCC90586_000592 [Pythium insidiosum]